jgi:hypothetical protein
MAPPPRVRTQMLHIGTMTEAEAQALSSKLVVFSGVEAVTILLEENAVLLKVSQLGWDEEGVRLLIQHKGHVDSVPDSGDSNSLRISF